MYPTGAAFTTAGTTPQWYNMDNQYQKSYYGDGQQMSGINNYASAPQTSYYTANQQTGSNYGQGYNWQQQGWTVTLML